MLELTKEEWDSLRCNISTLNCARGKHPKYMPNSFTKKYLLIITISMMIPECNLN